VLVEVGRRINRPLSLPAGGREPGGPLLLVLSLLILGVFFACLLPLNLFELAGGREPGGP
jgi:hypothetical protein